MLKKTKNEMQGPNSFNAMLIDYLMHLATHDTEPRHIQSTIKRQIVREGKNILASPQQYLKFKGTANE